MRLITFLICIFILSDLCLASTAVRTEAIQATQALNVRNRLGESKMAPSQLLGAQKIKTPGVKERGKISEKKIIIEKINLEGVTVYPKKDVEAYLDHLLMKQITADDVAAALEKLVDKYWKDGYILAEAEFELKDLHDGDESLKVRIYEGYIHGYKIEGGNEGIRFIIENYVNLLKKTKPFNTGAFEHYDGLIHEIPGLTVVGNVHPLDDVKGGGSIEFKVSENKLLPYAEIDNRGSRYIGPVKSTLGLRTESTIRNADYTVANFTFTPGSREMMYGMLVHNTPLTGTRQDTIQLRLDHAVVYPGFTLEPFKIKGTSSLFQIMYRRLVFAFPEHQVRFFAGFEFLNSDAIRNSPVTTTLYNDKLRSFIIGGSDHFTDRLAAKYLVDIRAFKGIDGLGSSNNPSQRSLPQGKTNYTKFMGELIRIQPLPKRFSLLTQVKGQYALDSLLSPAQFVFGSYPYGSGYEPAELGGDHGLAARAELRYGFDTSNIESIKLNNLLVYGFYDIGKAWNKDATSGPAGKSAASTGLGARLLVFDAIGMDFEVTKALTHGWRTRQVYSGNKKPWRFLFKLETRF